MKRKQKAYQEDPVEVETLYKAEEPFMKIEEPYFGYQGVILRNKINDTIQCHICGLWFKYIAPHARVAHSMKLEDYKIKFSLPLNAPLCSKKMSDNCRQVAESWDKSHPMKLGQGKEIKRNKSYLKRLKYSLNNMGRLNALGACEEQVQKRYLIIADKIGSTPTSKDVREHDNALYSLIERRYEGFSNFCNKFNYELKRKPFTRENLVSLIRERIKKEKRIPSIHEFVNKPSRRTIIKVFGSYKRCLSVCGII